MTANQTSPTEKFQLFRHVRNSHIKDDAQHVSNLGGVTLYIEVDQKTATMDFSVAVCGYKDNFSKEAAKAASLGRFAVGKKMGGPYDRTKSLVDNCIELLNGSLLVPQPIATTGIKETLRRAARDRLVEYINKLPRVPFAGERLGKSSNAFPFPTAASMAAAAAAAAPEVTA